MKGNVGRVPDNVEIVRTAILENRSTWTEEDGLRYWHEDAEYVSVLAALEQASYRGHAELAGYIAIMREAWSSWTNEPQEVVEVSPGVVLAAVRFRAVGRGSGVAIDYVLGCVFELEDGLIVRGRAWADPAEARRAAGV